MCVSACNRATARIPTSGIVEGGGELVFRRLTELGKQWTFDCSRFSSGFTTVESEFLVSRYLLFSFCYPDCRRCNLFLLSPLLLYSSQDRGIDTRYAISLFVILFHPFPFFSSLIYLFLSCFRKKRNFRSKFVRHWWIKTDKHVSLKTCLTPGRNFVPTFLPPPEYFLREYSSILGTEIRKKN